MVDLNRMGMSNTGGVVGRYSVGGLADFVVDTMTEAGSGESDFNAHVGETGATWTDHPHANYPGPLVINADLDRVYGTGTSASYASGIPPSADYYVEADFHLLSAIAVNLGVAARMDTTADTMYYCRLNGGTTWELRKWVAAAHGLLGTSTNNVPTVGTPKRGRIVVAGDQISFYVEGALEIGPITDTEITAAGRAGIRSAGASSATTGVHLDNFNAR